MILSSMGNGMRGTMADGGGRAVGGRRSGNDDNVRGEVVRYWSDQVSLSTKGLG